MSVIMAGFAVGIGLHIHLILESNSIFMKDMKLGMTLRLRLNSMLRLKLGPSSQLCLTLKRLVLASVYS